MWLFLASILLTQYYKQLKINRDAVTTQNSVSVEFCNSSNTTTSIDKDQSDACTDCIGELFVYHDIF